MTHSLWLTLWLICSGMEPKEQNPGQMEEVVLQPTQPNKLVSHYDSFITLSHCLWVIYCDVIISERRSWWRRMFVLILILMTHQWRRCLTHRNDSFNPEGPSHCLWWFIWMTHRSRLPISNDDSSFSALFDESSWWVILLFYHFCAISSNLCFS